MSDRARDTTRGQAPGVSGSDGSADAPAPVVVKKYANRRLYNTESSTYITLENLAEMVRKDRDFVVYDAKTGDDITRSVLTQIIVEEEGKGPALLPTTFLRQLIGLYGGSVQASVPRYLEQTMANFARQQRDVAEAMSKTIGTFMPPGMEDVGRKNLEMMERAMTLFTPFYAAPEPEPAPDAAGDTVEEIQSLRTEVERLQQELTLLRGRKRTG